MSNATTELIENTSKLAEQYEPVFKAMREIEDNICIFFAFAIGFLLSVVLGIITTHFIFRYTCVIFLIAAFLQMRNVNRTKVIHG